MEVHFIIYRITAACVKESSDANVQAWLLKQRMQEVLLNVVSVEDASLDGIIPKGLLQRLIDVTNVALGRMSEGFSTALKFLKKCPESNATPTSPNEPDQAEVEQVPDDGHVPNAPSVSQPSEKTPAAPPKKMKKTYDIKDKVRALALLASGMKAAHVAEHFQTHPKTIRDWRDQKTLLRKKIEEPGGGNAKHLSAGGRKVTLLKGGKHHRCGKCGKQFKTGIELRVHQRRKHVDGFKRTFSCGDCNEIFTRHDLLARHKLTHGGPKSFECEYCHKSFARKDKLRAHQPVHSEERPFSCSECGYRYASTLALKKHRSIHRAT